MEELMLKIDNVSKKYKLGQIGGTTLRDELQRKRAKRKGLEDPTVKIGFKSANVGEDFFALSNVSFKVKKGERIGIIGHNGAGKSTLLKLISRVTVPTKGTISMNGRVASMLEVGTGFHPELTGRENIYMNGAILGMTKKEIDSKIEDIIEFSECRKFIDTPVKRYSSGMYVKLAFSVAAHLDSEIMIMDEVLAVGDINFQKKCINKMNDVSKNNNRTILYVSHNMNTIRELCNRVIVLDKGVIIYDGSVTKGIDIYMNNSINNKVYYDYSNFCRKWSEDISKIKLLFVNMKILNKQDALFSRGETIKCRFICLAQENCNDVGIRLEIFSNGEVIGTMFSNRELTAKKGCNITFDLSIDTKMFVPGRYSITLLTYEKNSFGGQEGLDRIEDGIVFEISDDLINGIVWRNQDWGSLYLGKVSVEDVE